MDAVEGKLLWVGQRPDSSIEGFSSISFTPDEKYILTTSLFADSRMRLWSVKNGEMVKVVGPSNQYDATFSPDGTMLLSADRMSGTIFQWNSELLESNTYQWNKDTRYPIITNKDECCIVGLFLSPNGKILAGLDHWDGSDYSTTIYIYSVEDWKLFGKIKDYENRQLGINTTIRSDPVFNAGGGILAYTKGDMVGDPTNQVILWDTLLQKKLMDLDVCTSSKAIDVKFSHDGRFLIVRYSDGTAQIFGVPRN